MRHKITLIMAILISNCTCLLGQNKLYNYKVAKYSLAPESTIRYHVGELYLVANTNQESSYRSETLDKNSTQVLIYPNPTTLSVELILQEQNPDIYHFRLYNTLHQLVSRGHFTSPYKLTLPPEKGIYLLNIFQNDQLVFNEKIIKL